MSFFNLNADLAEGYGPWEMGDDAGLLTIINSANVACGFHAGDYNIMGNVIQMAELNGVSIGAHPGFYDLHGFGRRAFALPHDEIERLIAYQVGATVAMGRLYGARVTHVKPHGALNNLACADLGLSKAIARAVSAVDQNLILLAPALSELVTAGRAVGLTVAEEFFADRAYMPDGQLAPRSRPDAMIHDSEKSLAQCLRIFLDAEVKTLDGSIIKMEAQSVCVHGDGPTALATAKYVRDGLMKAGLKSCTLSEMFAS
jgi:UPF0271 protein|tara:strand:+ start:269 stop:1042 length:774 start_codon:yes stop_codon:yes gene_type:complete